MLLASLCDCRYGGSGRQRGQCRTNAHRDGGYSPRLRNQQSGSASELEYHLLLSRDLNFLDSNAHEALHNRVTEVKRMLASLIQKVDVERNRFKN